MAYSAAEYFADQLERLLALPITTSVDVEEWYKEANNVERSLEQQFPEFEPEHEVWHFFSDADICSRDVSYRDRQHAIMREYVRRLRHGSAT